MFAYIALFSALLSRLTALACGSTRVTSFIARFFLNIHQSGVLTVLAWLVPHETAAVLAQVLCTPYNHAPCHFMQSHICKVYACLAVTCHLHFWQNDRDLLRATVVTRGWNGYRNNMLIVVYNYCIYAQYCFAFISNMMLLVLALSTSNSVISSFCHNVTLSSTLSVYNFTTVSLSGMLAYYELIILWHNSFTLFKGLFSYSCSSPCQYYSDGWPTSIHISYQIQKQFQVA